MEDSLDYNMKGITPRKLLRGFAEVMEVQDSPTPFRTRSATAKKTLSQKNQNAGRKKMRTTRESTGGENSEIQAKSMQSTSFLNQSLNVSVIQGVNQTYANVVPHDSDSSLTQDIEKETKWQNSRKRKLKDAAPLPTEIISKPPRKTIKQTNEIQQSSQESTSSLNQSLNLSVISGGNQTYANIVPTDSDSSFLSPSTDVKRASKRQTSSKSKLKDASPLPSEMIMKPPPKKRRKNVLPSSDSNTSVNMAVSGSNLPSIDFQETQNAEQRGQTKALSPDVRLTRGKSDISMKDASHNDKMKEMETALTVSSKDSSVSGFSSTRVSHSGVEEPDKLNTPSEDIDGDFIPPPLSFRDGEISTAETLSDAVIPPVENENTSNLSTKSSMSAQKSNMGDIITTPITTTTPITRSSQRKSKEQVSTPITPTRSSQRAVSATTTPVRSPQKKISTTTPTRSPQKKISTTTTPLRSQQRKISTTTTPTRSPQRKISTTTTPIRSPQKISTTTPTRSKISTTTTPRRSPQRKISTTTPTRSQQKKISTTTPTRSQQKKISTTTPTRSQQRKISTTTTTPTRSPQKKSKEEKSVPSTPTRSPQRKISTTTTTPIRSPQKKISTTTTTPTRSQQKISTTTTTPVRSSQRKSKGDISTTTPVRSSQKISTTTTTPTRPPQKKISTTTPTRSPQRKSKGDISTTTPVRSSQKKISTTTTTPVRSPQKKISTTTTTPTRSQQKKISTTTTTPVRSSQRKSKGDVITTTPTTTTTTSISPQHDLVVFSPAAVSPSSSSQKNKSSGKISNSSTTPITSSTRSSGRKDGNVVSSPSTTLSVSTRSGNVRKSVGETISTVTPNRSTPRKSVGRNLISMLVSPEKDKEVKDASPITATVTGEHSFAESTDQALLTSQRKEDTQTGQKSDKSTPDVSMGENVGEETAGGDGENEVSLTQINVKLSSNSGQKNTRDASNISGQRHTEETQTTKSTQELNVETSRSISTERIRQMTMREYLEQMKTKPMPPPVPKPKPLLPRVIGSAVPSKAPTALRQKKRKTKRLEPPTTLPKSLTKEVFTHFAKCRVTAGAIDMVVKTSEIFWRNLSRDLSAITAAKKHSNRIESKDVEKLMKRQGLITSEQDLQGLVIDLLPTELWNLFMPFPNPARNPFKQPFTGSLFNPEDSPDL